MTKRQDFYLIIQNVISVSDSGKFKIHLKCKSLIDNSIINFTVTKGTVIYNNLIKAKLGTRIFVNGIPDGFRIESVKIGNKKNYDKMEQEFPEYFL